LRQSRRHAMLPAMPAHTARDATPAEVERFRAHLRHRAALRAQGWLERRQRAWRVADVAARRLRAEFGAEQVWVFGSLARDGVFDEHADIDLAVSGVDESAWFDATRMLLGLDGAFLIDLARLEGAPDALRRNILSEGILL
jgi:predicted nucleotidyltransferase